MIWCCTSLAFRWYKKKQEKTLRKCLQTRKFIYSLLIVTDSLTDACLCGSRCKSMLLAIRCKFIYLVICSGRSSITDWNCQRELTLYSWAGHLNQYPFSPPIHLLARFDFLLLAMQTVKYKSHTLLPFSLKFEEFHLLLKLGP